MAWCAAGSTNLDVLQAVDPEFLHQCVFLFPLLFLELLLCREDLHLGLSLQVKDVNYWGQESC